MSLGELHKDKNVIELEMSNAKIQQVTGEFFRALLLQWP